MGTNKRFAQRLSVNPDTKPGRRRNGFIKRSTVKCVCIHHTAATGIIILIAYHFPQLSPLLETGTDTSAAERHL
ncbi:hypothetical protein EYF80_013020 [Liparis tanakae]|uniref:Uncharacterized protein n=1 Tax=Liparis tanakae TaxID=230148 RepID=A0A4Z2IG66_9TELE|nr:hypothetical protein EYF80_013020 [Liparis tanakae]